MSEGLVETFDVQADELAKSHSEQIEDAQQAIAKEVATLEGYIATARGYEPEIAIAADFARAFPPAEPGYMGRMRTTIGVGPHVLNGVLVMWDARRLADVKARVAWLAQRLGKFTIEDYPEMGRRTYAWSRFKFSVFFNNGDDKTVCRFVEVGKEEKPVYKLMCGEEVGAE